MDINVLGTVRSWLARLQHFRGSSGAPVTTPPAPIVAQGFQPTGEPAVAVPYDENLLERARTQWQFGDWESLALLDQENLQRHPDRAKLALMAASGHQGLGDIGSARRLIRAAQDWGIHPKLVNRMVLAGAYDTLAKAAHAAGKTERVAKSVRSSISLGAPNTDIKIITSLRINKLYEWETHGRRIAYSKAAGSAVKREEDALLHTLNQQLIEDISEDEIDAREEYYKTTVLKIVEQRAIKAESIRTSQTRARTGIVIHAKYAKNNNVKQIINIYGAENFDTVPLYIFGKTQQEAISTGFGICINASFNAGVAEVYEAIREIIQEPLDKIILPLLNGRHLLIGLIYNIVWNAEVLIYQDDLGFQSLDEILKDSNALGYNALACSVGHETVNLLAGLAARLNEPIADSVKQLHEISCRRQRKIKKPSSLNADYYTALLESGLFNPDWYLYEYKLNNDGEANALLHYLEVGEKIQNDPGPYFSVKDYLEAHKDVAAANVSCLVHYTCWGQTEERYVRHSRRCDHAVREALPIIEDRYIDESELGPSITTNVKLIAFFLPQFHTILENDLWWGKGFTEWVNTKAAVKAFDAHLQPRIPARTIGEYDLSDVEVYIRQVNLAKRAGIFGFCFHFYWFAGKTLLERPLLNMLGRTDIDFPFCICWANENWTRRWDGLDNEVLMAQKSDAEDLRTFLRYTSKYFDDRRYIRIDEKPVLIIYRPQNIPDPIPSILLLREEARVLGYPGLYLVMAQAFGKNDPTEYGLDAAVQFPPLNFKGVPEINEEVSGLHRDYQGHIREYNKVADYYRRSDSAVYRLFKCAALAWDNTARRKLQGSVLHRFTLNAYANWVHDNAKRTYKTRTLKPAEKLMFVNAWNEWAEGSYLEPDQHYGYGYLEATRRALDLCYRSVN